MMREITGTVTCDRCGSEAEFDCDKERTLVLMAERHGWKCNAEDGCPQCVKKDAHKEA